jgi:hypothetical protein
MVEDLLPEFWIQQRKRKKEKRPNTVQSMVQIWGKSMAPELYPGLGFRV